MKDLQVANIVILLMIEKIMKHTSMSHMNPFMIC